MGAVITIVVVIVVVVVGQQEFLAPCRVQLQAVRKHFFSRGHEQLGGHEGRLEDGRQGPMYIRKTDRNTFGKREKRSWKVSSRKVGGKRRLKPEAKELTL